MNARVDFVAELPGAPLRTGETDYRPVIHVVRTEIEQSIDTAAQQATEADARHLRALMGVVGTVALILGLAVGYVFVQQQMQRPEHLVSGVGLVALGIGLLVGRLVIRKQNVAGSAARASSAILAFVGVVTLAGYASPALALTTLIAVLVAVPYVDRPALVRLGIAAWLVATMVGVSSGLALAAEQGSVSQALVRVVGVSAQTAIALIVIFHLSGRHRAATQRYRDLFQRVPVGLYRTTPGGRFIDVNRAFVDMFGYGGIDELTAVDATELYAEPSDRLEFQHAVDRAGVVRSIEYRARRADGAVFWVRDSALLVRDATGTPVYYEGIVEDVTERKQHELKLEQRASVDALTGLTNRAVLLDLLDRALGDASAERPVALLFVDLDGFKQVNDRYGHATGDEVLIEAGRRLQQAIRGADTIARFGGDEFAILLEVPTGEQAAAAVARRVVAQFSSPFTLASDEAMLGASVGVAIAREPTTAAELVHRADAAMYRAKAGDKVAYEVPAYS